ncbi:MAG: efflux RND transporter periplasmic adaptor subunit, partial [Armatimonadetes bacterium]|nr:efflux RND transporter periplasmic adaptor subunit [Armatimonadota bacterium]
DISSVYIQAVIGEKDIPKVSPGQEAEVAVPGLPGARLSGRVVDVAPSALRGQRNFSARVLVKNEGEVLKPGMSADVSLVVGEASSAVLAPRDAIVEDRDKRLVYAVEGGVVKVREVELGAEERGRVEIVSGVRAGDTLVVTGQSDLADGEKVQPVQREGGLR